jgi:alpha-amylase/alpha-mannosidase (GH57 family)
VERFICIHGHFYQPPRENPWLEAIEVQDSAYPYHDWNEKITAECYAPNAASRILDKEDRIVDIVGNYARISFNFGPTLLSWMETASPNAYQAIIEADRESMEAHSGHGNAVAQVYSHLIMPLANARDKRTQVKWGIRDFEYRFKRITEGMWLPETAVDAETLDIMAECGIKFTILAPHQAGKIRKLRAKVWEDVSDGRVDPTRAYLCKLASGRSITLFFYDGPISKAVAFEKLLNRGEDFVARLTVGFSDQRDWPQMLHIATDGETYGHHHKFADMALAFALHQIEAQGFAKLTNYGEYLAKYPAAYEAQIMENTSWSCAHGIERWRADCGCNSGGHSGWNQGWRVPLREALDWLRDQLTDLFEARSREYLKDPWKARDAYIDVILNRSEENIDKFVRVHGLREPSGMEKSTILKLMEMQRHLMLMYTSCGWFFDEISGIETVQVIQYASRAIQLAQDLLNINLEEGFKGRLACAKSNLAEMKDGAHIYERFVKPAMVGLDKVVAHYAISSLIEDYDDPTQIYCYNVNKEDYQKMQAGDAKLAVGRISVASTITLEAEVAGFSVLHLGGHIFNGGVDTSLENGAYQSMKQEIIAAFEKGSFADTVRLMDRQAGVQTYSLLQLFRDEQRKILNHVIGDTLEGFEHAYRLVYENNRVLMLFLQEAGMPVPKTFLAAAEFILNVDIKRALQAEEIDLERIRNFVNEVTRWHLALDQVDLEFVLRRKLEGMMDALRRTPLDLYLFSKLHTLMELLPSLPLTVNLWHLQNMYFEMVKTIYAEMGSNAKTGDQDAVEWVERFKQIGQALSFNIATVLREG